MGSGCWWPTHAVFGHAFGKGYMRFEDVVIGEAATIGGGCYISAGVSVPAGSHIAPLAIVTNLQPLAERCATYHGQNPPRRAERNKAGDYVVPNSKILPSTADDHMDARRPPPESDLESAAVDGLKGGPAKKPRRSRGASLCYCSDAATVVTAVLAFTLCLDLGLRQLGQRHALSTGPADLSYVVETHRQGLALAARDDWRETAATATLDGASDGE
eukprot:7386018-Prymnesium_polylepis.1